jgi:pimeloyl-ACP methyl ester carboxylesterase
MFKKYSVLLFIILFTACSSKLPNTWHDRVEKRPVSPIKLHIDEKGSGKPMILLHGFGTNSYSFHSIIEPLSKRYRVYNIDLKGFGSSPKPDDGRYSVYDQATLVLNFIKEHNLKDITLIGHSYGGGVALTLSLMDEKNIDKMVLIDAAAYKQYIPTLMNKLKFPLFGPLAFYFLPSSYEIEEGYKYTFYDKKKIKETMIKKLSRSLDKNKAKSAYLSALDDLIPDDIDEISKRYKTIKIPTLIIWGEDDISIDVYNAYRLNHIFPNSKLKVFPHVGHIPHEESPQKVIKEIRKFMIEVK